MFADKQTFGQLILLKHETYELFVGRYGCYDAFCL